MKILEELKNFWHTANEGFFLLIMFIIGIPVVILYFVCWSICLCLNLIVVLFFGGTVYFDVCNPDNRNTKKFYYEGLFVIMYKWIKKWIKKIGEEIEWK